MLANVLYLAALALLSPMILYRAIRHHRYRRGVGEKLFGLSAAKANRWNGSERCIWIHAVSVGEVNLVPGLIAHWKRVSPDLGPVVVSTSTDSGYDLAVRHFGAENVIFCPLDFSWAVERTLRNLRPKTLVLVELELWPNLIRGARRHGCEVVVINARLSQRSARRYQIAARWTKPIFEALDRVGCQDDACRERFQTCGPPAENLVVTGSLKFDDAPLSRDNSEIQRCLHWAGVDCEHLVWLVGSTQGGEEAMALQVFRTLRNEFPRLRLIVVPRHKERFGEVAELILKQGFRLRRRSIDPPLESETWEQDAVVLVDTIGELRNWWGTAHFATVGGSFGNRGGQNMLEPAGYGCAVSFGPDTRNFEQIADALIRAGGAVRVHDADDLETFLRRCLTSPAEARALGLAARETVDQRRGATERTVGMLGEPASASSQRAA